jgi:hypothetical protein
MTKLLEQAIAEVSKLPEQEQDTLAALILNEIASDRRWENPIKSARGSLKGIQTDVPREDDRV